MTKNIVEESLVNTVPADIVYNVPVVKPGRSLVQIPSPDNLFRKL